MKSSAERDQVRGRSAPLSASAAIYDRADSESQTNRLAQAPRSASPRTRSSRLHVVVQSGPLQGSLAGGGIAGTAAPGSSKLPSGAISSAAPAGASTMRANGTGPHTIMK